MEVKTLFLRRRSLDLTTNPSDDILGSVRIPDNTTKCFLYLAQIRRIHLQEPHPRTGVVASGRDRMQNFVGQRGSQFSHRAYAVYVGKVRLKLTQLLTLVLCALALRHIDVCANDLE